MEVVLSGLNILCVCLGNICRSPLAHAVLESKITSQMDEGERVFVDSAGTSDYHKGQRSDSRSIEVGRMKGYDLRHIRSRQVVQSDFVEFDYILAMDQSNFEDLKAICPIEFHSKIHLFLDFSFKYASLDVPDPYYGGHNGFVKVLAMIEDAADGFVAEINNRM